MNIHNVLRKKIIVLLTTCILTVLCTSSLVVNAAPSEPYSWSNVAIGGGGFVSGIIASKTEPNLMYTRTDVGGAYRWNATNQSWVPLLDWVSADELGFLGTESLAIDEVSPNNLYILAGISYFNSGRTAILKSTDYGESFSIIDVSDQFRAHGNGMGRQTGEKLQVDPNSNNILYAGTRWNGLFKSTDFGESWNRLSGLNVTTTANENGISFVVLDSAASSGATQTLFVGVSQTGTNFYRSDDAGQSFTAITGGPTTLMPARAELAGDGNLYITYGNGGGPHGHWALPEPMDLGEVWKYNTQTGTWTNVTPAGFTRPFGDVNVDPGNPNRVVLSTMNTWLLQENDAYGDRILITTNGGTTWTDVIERGFALNENGNDWIVGNAIHWTGSVAFNPFNTSQVWVTSGNGVFKTDNIDAATNVWDFTVRGLEETVPLGLISIEGGPLVSVIGDYDGFVHYDVTQYASIHEPRMGTTTGLSVAPQNPDVMLRVGSAMYYTTNMGLSWTQTATINGTQGQVAVSGDGDVFLHSPNDSNTTYRSVNNGDSWTTVSGITVNNARPFPDPVNPNVFYAYNPSGQMLISTDSGASFAPAGNLLNNGSKVVATTPGVEGHLWVALYWGGIQRSTDSGQTWTSLNGINYCEAVGVGKAAPGASYPTVYIWGTVDNVRGLYRSVDQGVSWVRVNDDDHEFGGPANGQFVVGDLNTYGRVYMSTAGRGIVYGDPQGGTTNPNASPVAVATVSTTSGLAPLAVSFNGSNSSDADGDSLSFSWSFGDGTSATGETVSHTYTQAGTYTATLMVTDGQGGADSETLTITVTNDTSQNTAPLAAFSVSNNVGDAPLAITFDGSASSDADGDTLTFSWDFGDGSTASGVTTSHSYAVAGSYTATLIVSDGAGGSNSTSQTITVTDPGTPTPSDDLVAVVNINNDWGGGYCAVIEVTNNSSTAIVWTVTVTVDGTVNNLWNGTYSQEGSLLTVSGVGWNSTIAAGQTMSAVGFCASR